ncbi:hypothetical protein AB0K00_47995 [Dactylosporangium sp. NPDC049525]|uniref:hypothetical protein n=1 Tax=Dactylosporangium sp. NPDC049525 TaxID=3154730 RepID=UPI003427AA19
MTVTTSGLTRAAGVAAVVAGLLFITVQIKHPHLDVDFITTTEWKVRQSMKVVMAVLSLAGITGMYLSQVRQAGVLGLLGYLLFGAGYLVMLGVEVVGLVVLPSIAHTSPGYVSDVLAVATGGHATGDVGLMQAVNLASAVTYLGGGLVFGIALFRAGVLARWAAAVLAGGTLATVLIPLLPQVNQRLFAVPTGVALIGLGHSLWRAQRTALPGVTDPRLDPVAAA